MQINKDRMVITTMKHCQMNYMGRERGEILTINILRNIETILTSRKTSLTGTRFTITVKTTNHLEKWQRDDTDNLVATLI